MLPYIDKIEDDLLIDTDAEVIKLKLLSGENHFERRNVAILDIPIYEADDNIDLIHALPDIAGFREYGSTSNHPDEQMQALMDQADFRRALSLAIDRVRPSTKLRTWAFGQPGHGFSKPGEFDPEVDAIWGWSSIQSRQGKC